MSLDILAEDPFGLELAGDPGDLREEVPRIVLTAALSGETERLTWIAGSEDLNASTPRSAVEGSKVVPDRSRSQGLVFHPGHESGRCVAFPLDESHSSIGGLGDMKAEVDAGIAGAE